jgi:hypothetical protein
MMNLNPGGLARLGFFFVMRASQQRGVGGKSLILDHAESPAESVFQASTDDHRFLQNEQEMKTHNLERAISGTTMAAIVRVPHDISICGFQISQMLTYSQFLKFGIREFKRNLDRQSPLPAGIETFPGSRRWTTIW